MHPYRPQWQYSYGFPAGSAEANNAYASYYQMYAGVPPQQHLQAATHLPEPVAAAPTPAYSSDFSSGTSGFGLPPAASQQPYQRRPKYHTQPNQNLHQVPLPKQPPPPPPQETKPESWSQVKQRPPSVTIPVPQTNIQPPAAAQQAGAAKPTVPIYPIKRFVRSAESGRGGVEDELDDSPICQRVYDVAVCNKVKVEYEKVENEVAPGVFGVRLKIGTEIYTGTGSSYKIAKQSAASKCLETTAYNKPAYKATMKARPMGVTATQELFEVAQRKGANPKFVFLEPPNFEFKAPMRQWTKDDMRGRYVVELTVEGQKFRGEADLPQSAKHNAALQALPVLHAMPEIKAPAAAGGGSADVAALGILPCGKNVIMVLNEIAMYQTKPIEWSLVDETGLPHKRIYIWAMKMGEYETQGSGMSKKIAKTIAAKNMYDTIPEEWKTTDYENRKKGKKRKSSSGAKAAAGAATEAPTPAKQPNVAKQVNVAKQANVAQQKVPETKTEPKPIWSVIQTAHPISALYEYCKKAKIPDPVFSVVSETVVDSNGTFKKIEYMMKLEVEGKSFFASSLSKKNAKTAVATEAWNIIRSGTM